MRELLEHSEALEAWIAQIESTWQRIPEFKVDPENLRHLAVICDGNRRAAQERGLNPYFGHRAGIEVIKGIARAAREWGINTLTFWTWSTENWAREKEQVDFVMGLAARFLPDQEFLEELLKSGVKFTHLGRKDRLPKEIRQILEALESKTVDCSRYRLNLAMDYGGWDETARAIQKMFTAFTKKEFNPEILSTTPQAILGFLDTAGQASPDLVVRTGVKEGEIPHTSGFLPLQTAYSGWVFLPDLFPNLTPPSLLKPIEDFLVYERRLGK